MDKNFLKRIWKESDNIIFSTKDSVELTADKFNNLVGRIVAVGPFYYYALNFLNLEKVTMEQQNPSLEAFFGIPANEMTLETLMSRIHPDDIPFIKQAENIIVEAIEKFYYKSVLDLKSSYCFRIKNKQGVYKLMLHQMMPIEVDSNGNFAYSINIHTNIEHITTINPRTISLFGFNGMPSFLGIDPYDKHIFDNKENKFTDRETEVLRCLASGYTSKEVSEKLCISEHTVKTHKRNILSKSEGKNMAQVIAESIKQGII